MPFDSCKPDDSAKAEPRLYRVVAARIQDLIREKGYQPGERLPAERDLAAKLGVSRASLREALIALEMGEVVEVRGGSGVYLRSQDGRAGGVPEAGPGPFEVLAARRLVETEVAAMAARNATDAAVDAILAAVLDMEGSHEDHSSHEQADRAFHLALAQAAGNAAMVGTVEYLWNQRGTLWGKLKEHYRTDALRLATLSDHRAILAAVAARDPAAARQAMRTHLDRVARTFSGT